MIKKLKRIAAAFTAAAFCVAALAAVPASAAEKKSVWSETKALTTAKYNSKYIKWAEKYSEKELSDSVEYGKSKTKKFIDKMNSEITSDTEYAFNIINKDRLLSAARKGDNIKLIIYDKSLPLNVGIYADSKYEAIVFIEDKLKITAETTDTYTPEYCYLAIIDSLDPNTDDSAEGKRIKFRSDDKIYCYEEFESDKFGDIGYLFTEKGTPIAMVTGGIAYCIRLSYSVDDSEFDIPDAYKEATFLEMMDILEKLEQ